MQQQLTAKLQILMKITTYLSIVTAVGIITAQAQPLIPVPVQQPDMATLTLGMTELALNSNYYPFNSGGAIASASSSVQGYEPNFAMDGIWNQTAYPWANEPQLGPVNNPTNAPWLSPDHPSPPNIQYSDWWIADFTGTNAVTVTNTVGLIVVSGRYAARGAGTYTLEYTTDLPPIGIFSTWTIIGTYTWASTLPLPRLGFEFPAISNMTGFQLVSDPDLNYNGTNQATGEFWANSIQEVGIYAPFTNAPTIVNQPQGTNAFVSYDVLLEVAAAGGTHFQWYKNGGPISGATSNTLEFASAQLGDSGTYSVSVSNLVGSVKSSNAVVNVTIPALRVLNDQSAYLFGWTNIPGYTYAVQGSANPGGPWTTITNWTVNVGPLVETAIPKPTGYNYYQLTDIAHP